MFQKQHKLCITTIGQLHLWKQSTSLVAQLYVETRPSVIRTGKNEYGRAEIWVDGYKNEGAKINSLQKT